MNDEGTITLSRLEAVSVLWAAICFMRSPGETPARVRLVSRILIEKMFGATNPVWFITTGGEAPRVLPTNNGIAWTRDREEADRVAAFVSGEVVSLTTILDVDMDAALAFLREAAAAALHPAGVGAGCSRDMLIRGRCDCEVRELRVALALLDGTAEERVAKGHADHCAHRVNPNYPCSCGHDAFADAVLAARLTHGVPASCVEEGGA